MKSYIWDFWARKYERLWVQKYSLRPTRKYILSAVSKNKSDDEKVKILDLGCGPGELIEELSKQFNNCDITGIDFSDGMLEVSKSRNPNTKHIKMDAAELYKLKDKFNIIICTHSLPYYKEPDKVMKELNRLLADNGKVFMGFASGNSLYDKLVLSLVKLTTGPAYYPSDESFKKLIKSYFQIGSLKVIKEKFYMPRIAIYTLRKAMI